MLSKIVGIINHVSANPYIDKDTLFCSHILEDVKFITTIEEEGYIENDIDDELLVGTNIVLEFSISRLSKLGFFLSRETFLNKNKYQCLNANSYIFELKKYLDDKTISFSILYDLFLKIINALKTISKHEITTADVQNLIIVKEEKSLYIPIMYDVKTFENSNKLDCSDVSDFIEVVNDLKFTDKKNIYINSLIEFLSGVKEEERFGYLTSHFKEYIEQVHVVFNTYLKDYSYNKIKLEVDSKILEFNQKLQGVINDAQGKLVAIPSAFVLVLIGIEYEKPNDVKNLIILVSTIVFAFFIQIFIENQKSVLKFIGVNIKSYKESFPEQLSKFKYRFNELDNEHKKQCIRIDRLQFLTWLIPFSVISVYLYLINFMVDWLVTALYVSLYIIIHHVRFYTCVISNKKM